MLRGLVLRRRAQLDTMHARGAPRATTFRTCETAERTQWVGLPATSFAVHKHQPRPRRAEVHDLTIWLPWCEKDTFLQKCQLSRKRGLSRPGRRLLAQILRCRHQHHAIQRQLPAHPPEVDQKILYASEHLTSGSRLTSSIPPGRVGERALCALRNDGTDAHFFASSATCPTLM
jgi:hypothetical protein